MESPRSAFAIFRMSHKGFQEPVRTAPDTLINLKQGGVSSAVLKAMAEASTQQ
jgi:hypothetical protein